LGGATLAGTADAGERTVAREESSASGAVSTLAWGAAGCAVFLTGPGADGAVLGNECKSGVGVGGGVSEEAMAFAEVVGAGVTALVGTTGVTAEWMEAMASAVVVGAGVTGLVGTTGVTAEWMALAAVVGAGVTGFSGAWAVEEAMALAVVVGEGVTGFFAA